MTARIGSPRTETTSFYRSGVVVNFDIGVTTNVLLRAVCADGSPLPECAVAYVTQMEEFFPIGIDGKLYLQGIARSSEIEIRWSGAVCDIDVPYPTGPEVISHLGDVGGQWTVRCQAQPGTFSLSIGPGLSGDQTARTMSAGGTDLLYCDRFRDPARVEIWGDGTLPSFVVSGARTQKGRPTFVNFPVYGRVYENQAPDPGICNDNLLVTVLF